MKKSTIGILIVSLLLVLIGAGLFVGGASAVGGVDAAKNELAKRGVRIDRGFQIDINQSKRAAENSKVNFLGAESMSFQTTDVRGMDLEVGAAEVEILEDSSAKEITVKTDGKYDIYLKNSVLYIKSRNLNDNDTLVIELPSDTTFGNVDIEAGAGVVEIERFNTKELEVEVGAGELVINQASVKECDIHVGMGSVEIYLEGSEEDYNYEIECGAGNVQIGQESFGGLAAEKHINNHAGANVEIECGMGSVVIGF